MWAGRPGLAFVAMPTGSETLRAHAPRCADALDAVVATTWAVSADRGVSDLVAEVARHTAELHGLEPLAPPAGPASGTVPAVAGDDAVAVLGFAEQCSLDVAAVTPGAPGRVPGGGRPVAGDLAAALWVVDVVPRTRGGARCPGRARSVAGRHRAGAAGDDLWGALDGLIRTVPSLDALDP